MPTLSPVHSFQTNRALNSQMLEKQIVKGVHENRKKTVRKNKIKSKKLLYNM